MRCDGPWTVIQRRGQYNNPQDYFYKTFIEYEEGFGSVDKELWIGLKNMRDLTKEGQWQLRVDLTDWDGKTYFARYDSFAVGPGPRYQLEISGYEGRKSSLGDSLIAEGEPSDWHQDHNGMAFSTKDKDEDKYRGGSCAESFKGAWWFNECHFVHLNGLNYPRQLIGDETSKGVVWYHGKVRGDTFKTWREAVMKIRKT